MQLFFIEDEHGNDKHIFARTVSRAAEQFVTWQMANEAAMGSFVVGRVTIASLTPPAGIHLREALAANAEGIGTYNSLVGWHIKPIEDERNAPA